MRSFANTLQSNSVDLIRTQSKLRQSIQATMNVLSYKPATFDNEQQKHRWDLIFKSYGTIRDSVIKVMDVGAEWFGFLVRLDYGLSYFYSSICNGVGDMDTAISKFSAVATEFEKFQEKNSDAIEIVGKHNNKNIWWRRSNQKIASKCGK